MPSTVAARSGSILFLATLAGGLSACNRGLEVPEVSTQSHALGEAEPPPPSPSSPCYNQAQFVPGLIPVIGRAKDVEAYKGDSRFCVLDIERWTPEANAAWVRSVAEAHPPYIVITTQLDPDKLWNYKDGQASVFYTELLQLKDLGYQLPPGSMTLPDGTVAPFGPSERFIALDPGAPPETLSRFTKDDAVGILRRSANLAIPAAMLAGIVADLTGVVDPQTGKLLTEVAFCADAFNDASQLLLGGARSITNLFLSTVGVLTECSGILEKLGVDIGPLKGTLASYTQCAASCGIAIATAETPILNFINAGECIGDCLDAVTASLEHTVVDRALAQILDLTYWRNGLPRDVWDRAYVPGLTLEHQPNVVIVVDGDFDGVSCRDRSGVVVVATTWAEFEVPWEKLVRFLLGQPVDFEKDTPAGPKVLKGAQLDSFTLRQLRDPRASEATRVARQNDGKFVFQYRGENGQWASAIRVVKPRPAPPCCGNGKKDADEICDGALGCDPGHVCVDNCSRCQAVPRCGNNVREGTEHCDGSDRGFCTTIAHSCNATCSGCDCNDVRQGPECGLWMDLCDRLRDNGDNCASLHGSAAWSCQGNTCRCVDEISSPPECGPWIDLCGVSAPGRQCPSGYSCVNSRCQQDARCGNNVREGGEYCDGSDRGFCTAIAETCNSSCSGCDCNDVSSGPECGPWIDLCSRWRDNGDNCSARYGSGAWSCHGNSCRCVDEISWAPECGGWIDLCGVWSPGRQCPFGYMCQWNRCMYCETSAEICAWSCGWQSNNCGQSFYCGECCANDCSCVFGYNEVCDGGHCRPANGHEQNLCGY